MKHKKLTVLIVPQRQLVMIFLMLYLARNINCNFLDENIHHVNNLQNLLLEAIDRCRAQGESSGAVIMKDEPLDIEVNLDRENNPEISK